jgi:biopolymer transport protein ExbD
MVEMNVTPLVDVMLVLLVIFIVTAPLIVPQSIKIDLPQTGQVQSQEPLVSHTLVMQPDGKMFYNNQEVSEVQLLTLLKSDKDKGSVQLRIHADETMPYGRMAAVMALAQSAGLTNLSFVSITASKGL